MGKCNCCLPKCTNNWRNSPGIKYQSLVVDECAAAPGELSGGLRSSAPGISLCSSFKTVFSLVFVPAGSFDGSHYLLFQFRESGVP